jgi:hypothetical protein
LNEGNDHSKEAAFGRIKSVGILGERKTIKEVMGGSLGSYLREKN